MLFENSQFPPRYRGDSAVLSALSDLREIRYHESKLISPFNTLGTSMNLTSDSLDEITHYTENLPESLKKSLAENWVFNKGYFSLVFKEVEKSYDIHITVNTGGLTPGAKEIDSLLNILSQLGKPYYKMSGISLRNSVIPISKLYLESVGNALLMTEHSQPSISPIQGKTGPLAKFLTHKYKMSMERLGTDHPDLKNHLIAATKFPDR
uniref:hypothetical protein n=1 Tax=Elmerina hispida TaxID=1245649 RepID=UPI00300122A2|nr:hypothetical protein [Elmerina hispida]